MQKFIKVNGLIIGQIPIPKEQEQRMMNIAEEPIEKIEISKGVFSVNDVPLIKTTLPDGSIKSFKII